MTRRNRCLFCCRFMSDGDIALGYGWESDGGEFGEEPPLFLYSHWDCWTKASEDRRRSVPLKRLEEGWAA